MVDKNILLNRLTANRVAVPVCLLYSLLTFLLPYRRILWNWTGGRPIETVIFHRLSLWIPVYFMVPMIVVSIAPTSWLSRLWNTLCGKKLVMLIGYGVLAICITMAVTGTYIVWWSWLSFGLSAAVIMLTVSALKSRVLAGEAIIIGIAIASLWRGLWEIPFQAGQKYIYDLPQLSMAAAQEMFVHVLYIVAPLILGGLLILFFYHWKHKGLVSFNKWFWVLTGLYVGTTALWFATGFWLEKVFIWETRLWVMTPDSYTSLVTYKSSKVWMMMAIVSTLLPKGKRLMEILRGETKGTW